MSSISYFNANENAVIFKKKKKSSLNSAEQMYCHIKQGERLYMNFLHINFRSTDNMAFVRTMSLFLKKILGSKNPTS